MPRLRLFTILCFDSDERCEAPRLVYRLDTRGAGLYRRQPVTLPPVPCHLRFTRQRHPPRQVTLPPPHTFSRPAAQRVIEVAALHLRLTVLYPRVEHQTVLAVVVVVVGPLVVHPYLDTLPAGEPRDQFHRQYFGAQLMEEAGLVQLAQQQYRMLFRMGLQMMVADWEPSLLEQLEQKFTAEQ